MRARRIFCSIGHARFKLSVVFLLLTAGIYAQNSSISENITLKTISGVVRDAKTKLPISSAQITSLTGKAASTADSVGHFIIKVALSTEILSVSAFDYSTREVSIQGKESVVIDLYADIFTSPYKLMENLTGVVNNSFVTQSLNSVDNRKNSAFITIDNVIQTQLGGNVRSVTRSGTSGVGASILIRGINSLYANTQPLYVVNGEIWDNTEEITSLHTGFYNNPLSVIDVADIESVTVVKDGTALYGSKASNGVILIQTKQKKGQVTKIMASGFWGITSKPKLFPVMDASQYRVYASELSNISGYEANNYESYFLNDNPTWPYYKKYHNTTNWQDNVYRNGSTQNYSLNINGGDDRASYTFSLGYTGDKGVTKSTDMQRTNIRFSADINFTKKLTSKWNIGFTNLSRNLLDEGVNELTSPGFVSMIKAPYLYPYKYTVTGEELSQFEGSDDFGIGNPDAIITNSNNTNKQYRFNIGVAPEYKFSENLSVKNSFYFSLYNVKENFYRPMLGVDSVEYIDKGFTSANMIQSSQSKNISLFNDLQLQFRKTIDQYHSVNMILGWRYLNNSFKNNFAEGHNTANDNYRRLENASIRYTDGLDNRSKSVSGYLAIDYSFKNRYLLSATADMDASSRFGNETKSGITLLGKDWGMFYSVNGAWLVSSEQFMKSVGFINRLKVRAGYSLTGNDDIGYYNSMSYLTVSKYLGTSLGMLIGNIADNSIQWESTSRANVGLDLSVLNERVSLSADLYKSTTKDLLTIRSYPEITGLGNYWGNSGELANKGFEIMANIKVLNLRLLKWEVGASAGHYTNEIIALPEGDIITDVYGGQVITRIGESASAFYGYKTMGVFATQTEANSANLSIVDKIGTSYPFNAGDMHFVDETPDGIIDEKDKVIIGNPNPDVYGSFTSMIAVKDLTLDLLFTYSYGNDVYNYLRSQLESGSKMNNQSTAMLNRWMNEGQPTSQPKAVLEDPMGNSRFSDRWIEDGSYLKLKSITLSYKVPVKLFTIENIYVWVSANNVYTFTKYLGRDPEFSINNSVFSQGIDMGLLPNTQSYFVGLRLNL